MRHLYIIFYSAIFSIFRDLEANERIIVTFCPKNIRRVSDGFGSAVVSWKFPNFVGKSETTRIRVFPSKQAGKPFPVGETAVSYKAIDDFGNEAWCNFTVTVVEGEFIVT